MASLTVRTAAPGDAPAINRIYNHYIRNTTATFDLEPWSVQRREAWLGGFTAGRARDSDAESGDNPYYALVAELHGEIIGFAFNAAFRPKAAYRRSTETTIYTAPENQTRGAGAALYTALFQRLAQTDLHRAYAVIALPNPRSVAFHQRFGFTPLATLREVGHKFGGYVDVVWLEKALK